MAEQPRIRAMSFACTPADIDPAEAAEPSVPRLSHAVPGYSIVTHARDRFRRARQAELTRRLERILVQRRELPQLALREVDDVIAGRFGKASPGTSSAPTSMAGAVVDLHASDDDLAAHELPRWVYATVRIGEVTFVVSWPSRTYAWVQALLQAPATSCGQWHLSPILKCLEDLGEFAERLDSEGCPSADIVEVEECPGDADLGRLFRLDVGGAP